ncbi:hypothetical protein GCM10022251_35920 [Phytohabitans flavus]|uniref:Uncharacterized protein n=1 Tax=Phytohabitans flavus TaxID=1076124 RepID=A0A6F8XMJ8_9ACTN|nr:hypothetical protein Pflav_014500 [Phytohabitans flavus]
MRMTVSRPHGEARAELPAIDEVDLRQVDERLRVLLVPNAWMMPRRKRRPPAIYLRVGEWVRWRINYRSSGTCPCGQQWSYRFDTLSLAHGRISTDTFLAQPTYMVDERAYLRESPAPPATHWPRWEGRLLQFGAAAHARPGHTRIAVTHAARPGARICRCECTRSCDMRTAERGTVALQFRRELPSAGSCRRPSITSRI